MKTKQDIWKQIQNNQTYVDVIGKISQKERLVIDDVLGNKVLDAIFTLEKLVNAVENNPNDQVELANALLGRDVVVNVDKNDSKEPVGKNVN